MSYCREHHHDLVHITTNNIQEQVAERAKNATSAHVWLGLRYTCKFNFWFWTKSNSGCYQNWAPGQGSERTYDCGVTGAIEATGRQQPPEYRPRFRMPAALTDLTFAGSYMEDRAHRRSPSSPHLKHMEHL
ncbi:putative macrophage mannose receptor 1-like [Scophthalmus maximus]|uniref:Putative macrophage mannose receptor 1-like n=1 Tax=Scophthalmus maximus TaxID=52904 RepID=A0A2U9AYJ2_SCOMX|nr:putative macrophage mannose receptor 1-like [Scophthalmus maximus]